MRNEYHFEELASTQDYAKELILNGNSNFLVYSDIQTKGRGRLGRAWDAPNGGLWFSFDVGFDENKKVFTLGVGVAVREVLEDVYKRKVQLKWPNDLILENKKAGGIICEKINDKIIIGIGINTNNENVGIDKAISFYGNTGVKADNYDIMIRLVRKIAKINEIEESEVIKLFRENMAYKGEKCLVTVLGEYVAIKDIAENGELIVEADDGIKRVFSGEINVCI